MTGLSTLASVRQAQGDLSGALEAVDEAEGVLPRPHVVSDLIFPASLRRARLDLAGGDIDAAAARTEQRGVGADDEASLLRERAHLVLVRVLLAQHTPEPALRLFERLHTLAVHQGRAGSVLELRVSQALAFLALGDDESARAAVREALALAAKEGHVRVFVDEGPPMAALLAALGPSSGQLVRLRAAFEAGEQPVLAATAPGTRLVPELLEPLTDRELQVRELLAAGKPNQRIADELVVALDTVKST